MPFELLEAIWCERYRCLPSQLENEDAGKLLLDGQVLSTWRTLNKPVEQLTARENELLGRILQDKLDWEREHGAD